MGTPQSEQQRQLRYLAGQRRRKLAGYIGLGLLATVAVGVVLYALMTT